MYSYGYWPAGRDACRQWRRRQLSVNAHQGQLDFPQLHPFDGTVYGVSSSRNHARGHVWKFGHKPQSRLRLHRSADSTWRLTGQRQRRTFSFYLVRAVQPMFDRAGGTSGNAGALPLVCPANEILWSVDICHVVSVFGLPLKHPIG